MPGNSFPGIFSFLTDGAISDIMDSMSEKKLEQPKSESTSKFVVGDILRYNMKKGMNRSYAFSCCNAIITKDGEHGYEHDANRIFQNVNKFRKFVLVDVIDKNHHNHKKIQAARNDLHIHWTMVGLYILLDVKTGRLFSLGQDFCNRQPPPLLKFVGSNK
jgi:hypothetical protein